MSEPRRPSWGAKRIARADTPAHLLDAGEQWTSAEMNELREILHDHADRFLRCCPDDDGEGTGGAGGGGGTDGGGVTAGKTEEFRPLTQARVDSRTLVLSGVPTKPDELILTWDQAAGGRQIQGIDYTVAGDTVTLLPAFDVRAADGIEITWS